MKRLAFVPSRAPRIYRNLLQILDDRYQSRRTTRHAKVTSVVRDGSQRAVGVMAEVDGVSQKVTIDVGMPAAIGDTYLVENRGTTTMPDWSYVRRIESLQGQPGQDITPTLPAPTSLSLVTGHYEPYPGGGVQAWIYAEWLHIGDNFGPMQYEVQYRLSEVNPLPPPSSAITRYTLRTTLLDGAIDASQTIIKRDEVQGNYDDFPRFGRIRIEDERIDYTKVRCENSDSGTGTGSSGQLVDSGKSWDTDEWEGYCLTDSGGTLFHINSNNATTLYVTGTPASGSYTIKPCFSGCTRGAGGSGAATHADNAGVASLSWGIMLQGLVPDVYYDVRVRCNNLAGAISAWASWSSISTSIDTTAPPDPTGLAATPAVDSVELTWTGPTTGTTPDLAGFEVYRATDSSGTGATLIATLSVQYQHNVRQRPGRSFYFNLKAFDYAGNISAYGEATWVEGYTLVGPGVQLLVNADWERDFNYDDVPDGWEYAEIVASVNKQYGAYGLEGTTGLRFSPTDEASAKVYWPEDFPVKIRVQVGEVYTVSIYFQTTEAITDFDYGWSNPDGKFSIGLAPYFHDGVSSGMAAWNPSEAWEAYALGNNWYRIYLTHTVTAGDVNYGREFIGLWLFFKNRLGSSTVISFDRPKLERGELSEWSGGINPPGGSTNTSGLLIDVGGIQSRSSYFMLDDQGQVRAPLVLASASGIEWSVGYDSGDGDIFKVSLNSATLTDPSPLELLATASDKTRLTIGSLTAGDPILTFEINGVAAWTIGADDSDSNIFKINAGSILSANSPFEFRAILDSLTELRIDAIYSEGGPADPTILFALNGTGTWIIGIDDSDGNRFKIHQGTSFITGSDFEIYPGGIVFCQGDFRAADGIVAGNTSLNPTTGNIIFTGQLVSYKNSTQYPVFGTAMVASPSIAGPYSSSSSITVTSYGIPSGAKSVLVMIKYTESGGSSGVADCRKASGATPAVPTTANTSTDYNTGEVEVSSDAIYLSISGGSANQVYITFLGYTI